MKSLIALLCSALLIGCANASPEATIRATLKERLPNLPKEGVKKIKVVCPSFISDCLETLEEIEERGKEDFIANGGEKYEYIPCVNTSEPWVNALVQLIEEAKDAPYERMSIQK